MLAVQTNGLRDAHSDLRRAGNLISEQIKLLGQISGQLCAHPGMESLAEQVRAAQAELEVWQGCVSRLSQSIDMIAQCYSLCEERVLDYADHPVIEYRQEQIAIADIRDSQSWLFTMGLEID